MAQAGVYAPGAVIAAEVEVRVNGVLRHHASMNWAGDTTGGLPAQVVSAGTGMKSRTGRILWAQEDVQTEPPHPLRRRAGWPPREGDEVVIDATVDTGQGPYTFRRFTGRLGRTTGSLVNGTLASEITDTLGDALSTPVKVDPLGPESDRSYTRSSWVAYSAVEWAGLGAVPRPGGSGTVLHIGGQGGAGAQVGTTRALGVVYLDTDIEVYSDLTGEPLDTDRDGKAALVVARGSRHYDSAMVATLEDAPSFTLHHAISNGGLTLSSSTGGVIWNGVYAAAGPHPVLALLIESGRVRVWDGGAFVEVVTPTPPSSSRVTEARGAGRVGALHVRYCSVSDAIEAVSSIPAYPASLLRSALETTRIPATRGVENVTARSVVDAWSEATLASVWMDEHGRARMVARDRLLTASVSRTVQVAERVSDGSWSIGHDSVYSRVVVSGEQASVESRSTDRVLIYQEQSTRTVEGAEVFERFIEAPSEEEWGPIDLTASRWQGNSAVQGTLPATGTWIHAVVIYPSGPDGADEDRWAWDTVPNPSTYDITIERLGQRTLKVTETVAPGSGVEAVYLKSPERKDISLEGRIRSAYRDIPSPTIRGRWKSTWADYTITGATTGPSWAPALELDCGWWLTPEDAQQVADALAAEVTQPAVTLSGVSLLWDPRRQIGDVEEWIATDSQGEESWRATVLVSGYSESWDGNVPSQSVDVRVISMTDPTAGKTYADLAAAYPTYGSMSGTYQQTFDALPVAL